MDLSSKHRQTLVNSTIAGEPTVAGEMGICYKECLKNHAANLGGHALDGCGEFMPTPTATPADPSSLRCAGCGCHRNFHRRDPSDHLNFLPVHPASSPSGTESPPSQSLHHVASPVPFSYYTSAPHHVHLSLSSGFRGPSDLDPTGVRSENSSKGAMRKRTRTKFTPEQKMKMRAFAEKAGWKINGCDEKSVREFCSEVGIGRGVLKVWMHNNKYSLLNGKNIEILSVDHHPRLCLNTQSSNNGGGDGDTVDGSSSS
ncbi:Zinc-finger homeodomain protein 11 [Raphanus sativus]|uniref:Zinc-finger homeodomain protein 11-like n=1 Tax=Raphanus sativus TaxID=3726 RepID=A0A6J0MCR7_RAPSA|nr:zinc-finger homeodomain protein 11-like [Raphanus sativus]KAJ4909652.1 Zinc-finger homeodomain protein 11 [Raphanus sativus]